MLIGSRAISVWNPLFVITSGMVSKDWDIIGEPQEEDYYRKKFSIPVEDRIEWHSPLHLNNQNLRYMFEVDEVCNPYGLAIIYRSHLWREYKWDSHIAKYFLYVVPLLANNNHLEDSLLKERIKLTKVAYIQGNPNLMQSNEDFFDDKVVRVYDHDYLHELFAYEDRPMFERLKKPDNFESAWCEKDLWQDLSDLQKLQCVAEETQVIASERFLIPKDWDFSSKRAYYMALKKVCTTLCSGWFRDYAIDHFPEILDMYDPSRFETVKGKLIFPKEVTKLEYN